MQQQKIIQIGNSIGMTFPKSFTQRSSLSAGQTVTVTESPDGTVLTISTHGATPSSVTPRFLTLLEKVNKQYGEALQKLASK